MLMTERKLCFLPWKLKPLPKQQRFLFKLNKPYLYVGRLDSKDHLVIKKINKIKKFILQHYSKCHVTSNKAPHS
jgi:hypothetical protein